ncbi:hypothetical protein ACFE04_011511 [Oxalis oulophora]
MNANSFKSVLDISKAYLVELMMMTKKLVQDDPRRIIHSLKVGFTLSVISLFYYYQPLYSSFGVSAMWAVMTVVVVFEFSVGATLGKGVNRGFATLLAGALGIGAHHLASLSGRTGEPILLCLFVFVLAGVTTFIRFFPKVKARYDYGMLIFMLTFSLVSVSGFRDDEILILAHKRLSTVLIGASACVIISICVFPVWAGQDLHNLITTHLDNLANFLLGFGDEYFETSSESKQDKSAMQAYKSVLTSKSSEESLANFATWEPGHGRFQFRHPWKMYLQVGTLTRLCAYRIDALNGYLNADIQAPVEIRSKIQEVCIRMSSESGKALKELALAMKKMNQPSMANIHIENSKTAAKNLNSLLTSGIFDNDDILSVMPAATVASLLIDIVNCMEKIAVSVHELAKSAKFKPPSKSKSVPLRKYLSNKINIDDCPSTIITIVPETALSIEEKSSQLNTS